MRVTSASDKHLTITLTQQFVHPKLAYLLTWHPLPPHPFTPVPESGPSRTSGPVPRRPATTAVLRGPAGATAATAAAEATAGATAGAGAEAGAGAGVGAAARAGAGAAAGAAPAVTTVTTAAAAMTAPASEPSRRLGRGTDRGAVLVNLLRSTSVMMYR